ncbi:alcohol dehydrogenase catalytic domain-containing protein [Mycobacterium sp. E1747]|uniref:alcohol dehydrogenase catalytic domain-containing protein n=1 Tax=Mycobacterium sp. E1747 TaxID=1834128 RepID=UPI0007FE4676|nr:alcohol dehydrogenase catalytic domain-containing protein [Mycobacterium sp. E1747]OBH08877.1 hypothetical protein A5695_25615 [Mycobacterium sp. E1747]
MWAYRLCAPATFEKISVDALDASRLLEGQVLVRPQAAALCGSDYAFFRGAQNPTVPALTGASYASAPPGASLHEVAGDVVASRDPSIAVGATVAGWATGMDALAELVITEGASVAPYESMRATTAVVMQSLACVIYAFDQMTSVEDARVAVLGLGPFGLLFSHYAKTSGANHVVGIDRVDRSDVKGSFLLDEVVFAGVDRWAKGLSTDEERPERVIEVIGHQISTFATAIEAARAHGEIYCFGVPDDDVYPMPLQQFLRKNLTLRSGATPMSERRRCLLAAKDYLHRYPSLPDAYVTTVFGVHEVQQAFSEGISPSRGRLKIVLEY